jgi:CubicO group peptidase (beta-lactamase class C family)
MPKIIFLLLALMSAAVVSSQSFSPEKLNEYFDVLEANDRFMGNVAIMKNGKMLYTRATGYADVENKVKATPETKYCIGSVSKTFTASMIMMAVEEKKLTLDQPIEKYFPTIKNASAITVRQLLSHRSGIHNFTADPGFDTLKTAAKSREQLMTIISKAGSDFEPDAMASYSNSNFVLLSYLLEDLYGKTYGEILKEKITTPLGLHSTYFGMSGDIGNKGSHSYLIGDGWVKENPTHPSIPMGAGGIISTATDQVSFITALFNGKVVSKSSLREMMTIRDDLGLGLFVFPFNEKRAFGHTGGIDGYSALVGYFPGDSVAFAMLSNGSNFNTNNISIACLSAVFNQPYELPTFKSHAYQPGELSKYTGEYFNPSFPITITITEKDNRLYAQGSGQPQFPLESIEEHIFRFDQADAELIFDPEVKSLLLKQYGGEILFRLK